MDTSTLEPQAETDDARSADATLSVWASRQTPWWAVSVATHVLVIALLGLVSMAINFPREDDVVATLKLEKRPDISVREHVIAEKIEHVFEPLALNVPYEDIRIESDVLEKTELSLREDVTLLEDTAASSTLADAFGAPVDTSTADTQTGDTSGMTALEELIGPGGTSWLGNQGDGFTKGDGGGPGVGPNGEHAAFSQRFNSRSISVIYACRMRAPLLSAEAAIKWLAAHQEADGHWDAQKYQASQKTDTAVTGMALLAFLGYGQTETLGKYKDNVARAVAWLKSKQNAEGLVFDTSDAGAHRGIGYPHAIAGMALAEAAGMGRVPGTVAAAQKAADYSTRIHQQNGNDPYNKGAWRYKAGEAPDTSVTGWYVMQLKSAKVSGLKVDPGSFDGALKFLDKVEHPVEGALDSGYGKPTVFWYQPDRNSTTPRLCAIGNLCRQFMGWKKEDLEASVRYFVEQGGVPDAKKPDLYYWYYGTLCCFQQGGATWKKWNDAMHPLLTSTQRKTGDEFGSWDPSGEYSGEWGRVGQTALSCLCLEVYYRYLPMFECKRIVR